MKVTGNKTPVLVFNCDYNGLAVIQALGRRGVPVLALDTRRTIGTRSRYAKFHRVPDPLIDESGFIAILKNLGSRLPAKPLLFPTNDHWAETISKYKSELESIFTLCSSDFSTISLLLDKEQFGIWGVQNNLPVPTVWSHDQLLEQSSHIRYPIAVKANTRRRPNKGREWARAADKFRFRPCHDPKELLRVLTEADDANVQVFGQQIVSGSSNAMRTIGVYANTGRVHGVLYGRKVRGYPAAYGDCVVGQAEPVPQWAEDLVTNVCKLLNYTGIAEFEVMEDEKTSERFLIEINPRSWSWIGVAPAAGVDLVFMAYSDLILRECTGTLIKSCSNGESVIFAKLLADLQNSLLWYRVNGRADWNKSLREWWQDYSGKKRVFAEFARDDKRIGIFSFLIAMKQFGRNIKIKWF